MQRFKKNPMVNRRTRSSNVASIRSVTPPKKSEEMERNKVEEQYQQKMSPKRSRKKGNFQEMDGVIIECDNRYLSVSP